MSYSTEWLNSSTSVRTLLVEATAYDVVGDTEVTFYFSSSGYLTGDGQIFYKPLLTKGLDTRESLSISGGLSMSVGDVQVINPNGELDNLLDHTKYIWANRPIQVYFGDPRWVCTNISEVHNTFKLVFNGIISNIDAKTKNTINFKLRDKLQKLNVSVTEDKIGVYGTWAGGQQNEDQLKPLVFGEPHNIEPVLIDPAPVSGAAEYIVTNGAIESIVEIRDNGVPIYNSTITGGATIDLANGKFNLAKPLAGTCTCSVQGRKLSVSSDFQAINNTYANTIMNTIVVLVNQYGTTDSTVPLTDIDIDNFIDFNNNNPYSIGIYLNSRQNLLALCKEILDSVNTQMYFNRLGKLQLIQLGVYPNIPAMHITKADMLLNSFDISERTDIVTSVKLGYSRNYTIQNNLLTAIPQAHKNIFNTEWNTVTKTNTGAQSLYKDSTEPAQQDTVLISDTETDTEATRLLAYNSVPRTVYKFTGVSRLLELQLGQEIVLYYDRFGLDSGKSGQVISLSPDWISGLVDVEVII